MGLLIFMKTKTIQLIIKTDLNNEEIIEIMNSGTQNLNQVSMALLEIRVVGSANSLIKGLNYNN